MRTGRQLVHACRRPVHARRRLTPSRARLSLGHPCGIGMLVKSLEGHWRDPHRSVAGSEPLVARRGDPPSPRISRPARASSRRSSPQSCAPTIAGRRLLLGPRQVGKTVLLLQLADDLLDKGLPPQNLTYFDFSDERITEEVTARQVVEAQPVGVNSEYPRVFLLRRDPWLREVGPLAQAGGRCPGRPDRRHGFRRGPSARRRRRVRPGPVGRDLHRGAHLSGVRPSPCRAWREEVEATLCVSLPTFMSGIWPSEASPSTC